VGFNPQPSPKGRELSYKKMNINKISFASNGSLSFGEGWGEEK